MRVRLGTPGCVVIYQTGRQAGRQTVGRGRPAAYYYFYYYYY